MDDGIQSTKNWEIESCVEIRAHTVVMQIFSLLDILINTQITCFPYLENSFSETF